MSRAHCGNVPVTVPSEPAAIAWAESAAWAAAPGAASAAWPAMWACLLFGYLQAMGTRLQGVKIGSFEIPVQFINMLPYVMTVVLLAGFIGKSIPPKASGIPYSKDR